MSRVSSQEERLVDLENLQVPSLERRRLRAYAVLMVLDMIILVGCSALAGLLYEGVWWQPSNVAAAHAMLPIFLTVALYNQTYSGGALSDWTFGARQALIALILSSALLNFVAFYTKSSADFSRVSLTLGFCFSALGIVAMRRLVPVFVDRFWSGKTINRLVIDDDGPDFCHPKADSVSAAKLGIDPLQNDPFMRDRLGRLLQNRDKVIVTCPPERSKAWAVLLKSTGVYGEIVSLPHHLLGASRVNLYADQQLATLVVSTGPLALRSRVSKRLFDVITASASLLVLWPVLLVFALLIKLEDGGPVLFVQRRLGRGNQLFGMLKFRSMKVQRGDADGARSTRRADDRITRIGAFIRRNSIDELPQLINVLRGEMSIVGPRPHALGSRANSKLFWEVDGQYWHRHCLKPGLTGLAQVRGYRGATQRNRI